MNHTPLVPPLGQTIRLSCLACFSIKLRQNVCWWNIFTYCEYILIRVKKKKNVRISYFYYYFPDLVCLSHQAHVLNYEELFVSRIERNYSERINTAINHFTIGTFHWVISIDFGLAHVHGTATVRGKGSAAYWRTNQFKDTWMGMPRRLIQSSVVAVDVYYVHWNSFIIKSVTAQHLSSHDGWYAPGGGVGEGGGGEEKINT